ncbi:MAG: ABC transporter ATP-binding protein [Cetobacterium sp.]
MIEIKNVSKKYRGKYVVNDVSTDIPEGKITCIIGPNGAGKSTLLNMISRLTPLESGEIIIDGKNLESWDKSELAKTMATLKQENTTNVRLTVYELISFGRFPHSGGQKQRAYIAMTIAQNTKYILLDEPLNNLDMKSSVAMMKILQQLVQDLGKTIVIVMHDINFTSVYSDYILAMKNGKLKHMDLTQNIVVKEKLEKLYEMPFHIEEINKKNICVYF